MTFLSLTLACSLLFSAPVAPKAYFCTVEGRPFRYERRWADSSKRDGSIKWIHNLTIDEVRQEQGKTIVGYSSAFSTPDGRKMY